MSEAFSKYKLHEIANILAGGDLPDSFSTEKTDLLTIPIYSNGEKNNGLYGYTDSPKVTEPAVTISARGSKVGFAAIRKQPFFPIVRLLSLIPYQDRLDVNFLFYNLKLNRQSGTGSGQPQITIPDISNRTISVPALPTQIKIATVLSALDSKIELNNKINAELEGMAKLIYDYWFVQFDFPMNKVQAKQIGKPAAAGKPYKTSGGKMFWSEELKREIPEGWGAGTLASLGEIIGGSTPPRAVEEYFTTNGTAWITPKDLSLNRGNKFISRGELDVSNDGIKSASLNIMPKGTVLLSSRAPIGYLAISREVVTTNQGFKSFVPNKGFPTEYVYYAIMNMIPAIEKNAVGSTFKEVSSSTLKSIPIHLPGKAIVDDYFALVGNIFSKQNLLELENQKLSELRDWLLPMLMNGQVKVSSAKASVTKVGDVEENLSMTAEPKGVYRKSKPSKV